MRGGKDRVNVYLVLVQLSVPVLVEDAVGYANHAVEGQRTLPDQ